jgi:23S rRNA (cytosine1962-C5)-methyltransferase
MKPSRLKLRVSAPAERQIKLGHPWVYAESVREVSREAGPGEIAVVYDRRDKFLAVGFFDPTSPLRLRIIHQGAPVTVDDDFWRQRWQQALARRDSIQNDMTTGLRLINGESDGFPGLVVDRYAQTLVMKIYTLSWLGALPLIEKLIRETIAPERLVLRLSRNIQPAAARDWHLREGLRWGSEQEIVLFQENGIVFEAEVMRGQKTGFFLDQRENRARLESLAVEAEVLNAFSFSGGFSLYAARGGAKRVVDLDLSRHALASAERNFSHNRPCWPSVAACQHETIEADCFHWLSRGPDRKFDLIIVDPPSLAQRQSDWEAAMDGYAHLHAAAWSRLRPGGILLAASCSAHVQADDFFAQLRRTLRRSGGHFDELWTSHHAPDHQATFPEARYLKAICVRRR